MKREYHIYNRHVTGAEVSRVFSFVPSERVLLSTFGTREGVGDTFDVNGNSSVAIRVAIDLIFIV